MSDGYISELRLLPYSFAPKYWAACNGQLLPINQNQALFSLVGTTFGGNGTTTFGLPNLQGRVAVGTNGQFPRGAAGGEATHTLLQSEMPAHTHAAYGTTDTGSPAVSPSNTRLGANVATEYVPAGTGPLVTLEPSTLGSAGQSQSHQNMQPYQVLQWCICLVGIFPSRP